MVLNFSYEKDYYLLFNTCFKDEICCNPSCKFSFSWKLTCSLCINRIQILSAPHTFLTNMKWEICHLLFLLVIQNLLPTLIHFINRHCCLHFPLKGQTQSGILQIYNILHNQIKLYGRKNTACWINMNKELTKMPNTKCKSNWKVWKKK